MMNVTKYFKFMMETWWGLLILSSVILLAPFLDTLAGNAVFIESDLVNIDYPIYYQYHSMINSGSISLWDESVFSGFPTLVVGNGRFFSPFQYIIFGFLPFFKAFHLLLYINMVLGVFITAQFIKRLSVSSWGALFGGLMYALANWRLLSDITLSNAMPLLPLLMYSAWMVLKERNSWWIFGGGLTIGLAWLTVHPNWLMLILTAGGVFVLYLSVDRLSKFKVRLVGLLQYALMVLMGTAIGLVQIIPAILYTAISSRSEGLSDMASAIGGLVLFDSIKIFLPFFDVPRFSSSEQFYFGALPVVFILVAMRLKDPIARFFSVFFIATILISIKFSPFFWIIHQLPGYNFFRGQARWLFIGYFAAAVLVGLGVQSMSHQSSQDRFMLINRFFKWLLGSIVFGVISVNIIFLIFGTKALSFLKDYFDRNYYANTTKLPIDHYHGLINSYYDNVKEIVSFLNPALAIPLLFLIVSYFVLKHYSIRFKFSSQFVPIIVLVFILNIVAVTPFYYDSLPVTAITDAPKTAVFLQGQESGRVFSFLPGLTEYIKLTAKHSPTALVSTEFNKELLVPNLPSLYNLSAVDIYDNLMSARMAELLALIGSDRATVGVKLSDLDITIDEKINLFVERKNILNILGIKYIVSGWVLPDSEFEKIFETHVTEYEIPIYIYYNQDARPLVYAAGYITTSNTQESNVSALLSFKEDIVFPVTVECAGLECLRSGSYNNGSVMINVLDRISGDEMIFTTKSDNEHFVVFSENFLPGWTARVDGVDVDIQLVNGVYMGVSLEKGEHMVEFNFKYPGLNF